MGERLVVVKYELFADGSEERVGKSDRVEVPLDQDPEMATISFRDAVHERRRVRDLAHCSSANLRLFLSSDPDTELDETDFLQFLLDGAPERVRVVAPAAFRVPSVGSPHMGGSMQFLGLGPSRSRSGTGGRPSSDYTAASSGPSSSGLQSSRSNSRRESESSAKRSESDSIVVFVKTGDANFPIEVERTAAVDTVKARIKEQEQIPLEQQRLFYAGVELEPRRTLAEYSIHQGSELQLVLTLGGPGSS